MDDLNQNPKLGSADRPILILDGVYHEKEPKTFRR